MSYEGKMLEQLAMPDRKQVESALLRTLLKHDGVIKEFGSGQELVSEIADGFELNARQRSAVLETVYRKEHRIKHSLLWHRLLFRAADALARDKMVSRPSETFQLTQRPEWMLTEKGFDAALRLCNIPIEKKVFFPTKSYEVEKIVKTILEPPKSKNYDPIDSNKKITKTTTESALRARGFRQAVIEAYDCRCAVCGLKIKSPDFLCWEVEAAHIVPNSSLGRDDIVNGIALCHLHHWAFDVGWFTLLDDYRIQVSSKIQHLPNGFGQMGSYEVIRSFAGAVTKICLPEQAEIHPHRNAIRWHRQYIFTDNCD